MGKILYVCSLLEFVYHTGIAKRALYLKSYCGRACNVFINFSIENQTQGIILTSVPCLCIYCVTMKYGVLLYINESYAYMASPSIQQCNIGIKNLKLRL